MTQLTTFMSRLIGPTTATWIGLVTLGSAACDSDAPCRGAFEARDGWCFPAAASGGAAGAAGQPMQAGQPGGGAAGAGAAQAGSAGAGSGVVDYFGKACTDTTSSSECGGDAPICAPVLNYCTNVTCGAGEANEGICPDGWTCFPASGGNPSACVNL